MNDINPKDIQLRKKLLSGKMKDPFDKDFKFIVKRLRNFINPERGNMHLLITNTVFYRKGEPDFVLKRGKRESYGKYDYITDRNKLTATEIKKQKLKQNLVRKYLYKYIGEEWLREKHMEKRGGVFGLRVKTVSNFNLSRDRVRELDKIRKMKRQRIKNRFRVYFKKVNGESKF